MSLLRIKKSDYIHKKIIPTNIRISFGSLSHLLSLRLVLNKRIQNREIHGEEEDSGWFFSFLFSVVVVPLVYFPVSSLRTVGRVTGRKKNIFVDPLLSFFFPFFNFLFLPSEFCRENFHTITFLNVYEGEKKHTNRQIFEIVVPLVFRKLLYFVST